LPSPRWRGRRSHPPGRSVALDGIGGVSDPHVGEVEGASRRARQGRPVTRLRIGRPLSASGAPPTVSRERGEGDGGGCGAVSDDGATMGVQIGFQDRAGLDCECRPGGHLEAANPGVIGGQGGVRGEGAGDADGIGLPLPLICKPSSAPEAQRWSPGRSRRYR